MALEPGVLKAALLWARNHIDAGVAPALRDAIVQRLDDVLANHHPTMADMALFHEFYPTRLVGCPREPIEPNEWNNGWVG
jgi:hypothetical protein